MNDRDALMKSILMNPLEDTPRLMYADWCDENGFHRRAEFIRLQIQEEQTEKCLQRQYTLLNRDFRGRKSADFVKNWMNIPKITTPNYWLIREDGIHLHWDHTIFVLRRGFIDEVFMRPLEFTKCVIFAKHEPTTVIRFPSSIRALLDGCFRVVPHSGSNEISEYIAPFMDKSPSYTEEDAREKHSNACVDYARYKAGLPKIERHNMASCDSQ
jgi:uncharacterized protein (TIGR02996 family)